MCRTFKDRPNPNKKDVMPKKHKKRAKLTPYKRDQNHMYDRNEE